MKTIKFITLAVAVLSITACDFINRSSRTMDTMLGGDYEVHVHGFDKPFLVDNGKITSQPDKGYYIFYPIIDGKKRLVQSPINLTTIIEKD